MRLLIVTQKVDINDDVLGSFYNWFEEFARYCEKVIIICLYKGEEHFSQNVKVLSLNKEQGGSKLKYLFNFYKYIWRERKNYDAVFVHMNQEYILLGGLLWKLWGKKISLWYAHKNIPPSMRFSEKLADVIFTSTRSGFRLSSKKVRVVGQGIDTDKFEIRSAKSETNSEFKIISVGRISPSKNYETLIEAMDILKREGLKIKADIIGGVGLPEHENYYSKIRQMVREKNLEEVVNFFGPVSNREIIPLLQSSDMFTSMGLTGSLDKAVLEAMACGLVILTCNEALVEVLDKYKYKENMIYVKGDYKELADKIKFFSAMDIEERKKIGQDLRNIVVENHSLGRLIKKMMEIISNL
jgi:glycosyltransferase involved in cell wall biosynthesis